MSDARCAGSLVKVHFFNDSEDVCVPAQLSLRSAKYGGPFKPAVSAFRVGDDRTIATQRGSGPYREATAIIVDSINRWLRAFSNENKAIQAAGMCAEKDMLHVFRQMPDQASIDVPIPARGTKKTEIKLTFASEGRILVAADFPTLVAPDPRAPLLAVSMTFVFDRDLHAAIFLVDRVNERYCVINSWGCSHSQYATQIMAHLFSSSAPREGAAKERGAASRFLSILVGHDSATYEPWLGACANDREDSFQLRYDEARLGGLCLPSSFYILYLYGLLLGHGIPATLSDLFLVLSDILDNWQAPPWTPDGLEPIVEYQGQLFLQTEPGARGPPTARPKSGWRSIRENYFQMAVLGFYQYVLALDFAVEQAVGPGLSGKRRRSFAGGSIRRKSNQGRRQRRSGGLRNRSKKSRRHGMQKRHSLGRRLSI
jgi:hypothetical protein